MLNASLSFPQHFRCAGVDLDLALGVMTNDVGESQRLSPVNLKLLTHLLQHPGEVVSRAALFAAVWPNQMVSDDVLTRAVSDIRSQLTRLDADTRFIETLPKRGYRWAVLPVSLPVVPMAAAPCESLSPAKATAGEDFAPVSWWNNAWVNATGCGVAAVVLALVFMAWLTRDMNQPAVRLALLPTVIDGALAGPVAQALDEELARQLRQHPRIKLLSKSAVAARPANPFPYFYNEFGALWVMESRVSNAEGSDNIELGLVDARTGLEVRLVHFEAATPGGLAATLAKKLELLQELP
jgi:DNA-binding winged helix-turn-helix (wHTH) protein